MSPVGLKSRHEMPFLWNPTSTTAVSIVLDAQTLIFGTRPTWPVATCVTDLDTWCTARHVILSL